MACDNYPKLGALSSPRPIITKRTFASLRSDVGWNLANPSTMENLVSQPTPAPIADLLRLRASENPEHQFVRFEGESISYGRLDDEADLLAGSLARLGLTRGMTCALQLPNCSAFMTTWFALARMGVIEVPLNTELTRDLLAHQVEVSKATVVVTTTEWLPRFVEIRHLVPRLTHVLAVGDDAPEQSGGLEYTSFSEAISGSPGAPAYPELSGSDPAVALFTSGTTGPSKGVVRSHRANQILAATGAELMGYAEGEVLFNAFPLFHANARYNSVLAAMLVKGSVVLRDRFSVGNFWDTCRTEGITAFNYMGAVLMMLYKQAPRSDDAINPVRRAFGAPAPKEIFHAFQDRFGVKLVEVYGSTELGIATMNTVETFVLGSCGRAAPSLDIRIHNELDIECRRGETGQIVARSREPEAMFTEYLGMPEATLEAFRNQWFHTGDRAWMDESGYVWFVDRMKDCIRRRGENISSWEVERTISALDSVAEVAVVGVPSELSEEEVLAVLVATPGHEICLDEVLEHCRARLPRFAVPRFMRVIDALPKTPSQRVEKYRLRELGVTSDTADFAPPRERK